MLLFFVFVFIIPIIDQLAKLWIKNNIRVSCFVDTKIPFLKLTYFKNSGAALGFFKNERCFFIGVSIIVTLILLYFVFIKKIHDRLFVLGSSFVIGGGIGNLIDRVLYGSVTDYLKVSFFPPVCNISDYFISAGIILMSVYILKSGSNTR
jgi:signal peptidase II